MLPWRKCSQQLSHSIDGSAQSLLPPPGQLNRGLHTHPAPLLTQDVFCFPALNDEDVRGTSRDVGDEHVA